MSNIIFATFHEGKGNVAYTKTQFQYNRGIKVRVTGIALPETYQVHISNDETRGVAVSLSESGSDISVPDAFFQTGEYVRIWIYTSEQDETVKNGASEYMIVIPVEKRPAILNDGGGSWGGVDADYDENDHAIVFH